MSRNTTHRVSIDDVISRHVDTAIHHHLRGLRARLVAECPRGTPKEAIEWVGNELVAELGESVRRNDQ